MNRSLFIIFLIPMATATLHADVRIVLQSHTDSYYYGGVTQPEVNEIEEIWIGDRILASISERRNVVVDLNDDVLLFVNHRDSTYVETSLPFEWPNLVSQELAERLNMLRTQGAVRETDETKRIGEWTCERYDINTWIPYAGTNYNETETTVWATLDVPFDVGMYGRMVTILRQLWNYDDDLIGQLEKMKGFQIASETIVYVKGFGYQSTERVTEMTERHPSSDVYSVPQGYTQKENLSQEDLQ